MHLSSSSSPSIDRDLKIFVLATVGVLAFMVVFFHFCQPYDLATGMLYSFALGLLARGRLLHYLGVFALANLNRESAFLLVLVFVAYFLFRLPWRRYLLWVLLQVLIFWLVRAWIMSLYADHPGSMVWIRPIENLALFLNNPLMSLVHWAGFALVILLCARRWSSAPRLLQVALLVMLPLQLALYLVLGVAFEVRVFAEVYPVVWVMCNSPVTS